MKIIAAAVLAVALCPAARAQGPAPEAPNPDPAASQAADGGNAEAAKSGRAAARAETLAEAAVEGPGIEGKIVVSVACRVAAGKIADCDPANVKDPRAEARGQYIINEIDEKVNIAPDWKNSLKPAARDSMNPAREKALVKKMRRLTARLAYLNAAKDALNKKLADPGAMNPAESRKLKDGRLHVERSLHEAMHECSVLHGKMFDKAVLRCGASDAGAPGARADENSASDSSRP